MKRVFVILSAVSFLAFTSCDNENTTNPEPLGTVTINGAIYADMDEDDGDPDDDDLLFEKIPAGVTVYAIKVDDGVDGALLGTTTTTAEGYTFTLPIGKPTTMKVVVGDFNADVNFNVDVDDFESRPALYNKRQDSGVITVVKGATYIENIMISQPEEVDFE